MNLRRLTIPVLAGALAACGPKTEVDEAALFAVIEKNVAAMQKEDLEAVMDTLHPQSLNLAAARETFRQVFEKYDLRYEVRDLKVANAKSDPVKVSFVQRTRRAGGAEDFMDNAVEGVHTLKKDGDQWKIVDTAATRVSALNP